MAWDKYTISDEEWLEKYGNKPYYNSYLDKDKNYGMGTPMLYCDIRYKSKAKALIEVIIR